MERTLGDIAEECDELSHFNPFWRYIKQEANKDDLQALSGKLDGAIKLFQVDSHPSSSSLYADFSTDRVSHRYTAGHLGS